MTDANTTAVNALNAATALLQAHGFTNITAMPLHPGAAGEKKDFYEVRASLVYRVQIEQWHAVVTHGGAVLGNCGDTSAEHALRSAIDAAKRRLTELLKLLEGAS
jgi:hypothetical protein